MSFAIDASGLRGGQPCSSLPCAPPIIQQFIDLSDQDLHVRYTKYTTVLWRPILDLGGTPHPLSRNTTARTGPSSLSRRPTIVLGVQLLDIEVSCTNSEVIIRLYTQTTHLSSFLLISTFPSGLTGRIPANRKVAPRRHRACVGNLRPNLPKTWQPRLA